MSFQAYLDNAEKQRSDIERLLIRRHLEPQPHGRRDHQALLRRPVLGVVIVGIRLGLISRVRRDPASLGDSVVVRPDLDEIPRCVVVTDRRRLRARQLHRCDVTNEILRPRAEGKQLLRPVNRAEQLTLQNVGEVLAHRK